MTGVQGPRGYFLRSALWKAGGGSAGGMYSPRSGARTLHLGQDHASPVAQMVALHENFHSLLNASTTFGVAMVLAGALDQAGEPGMEPLIERMIDESVETHETYATMSGIYAAALSTYDRDLLEGYPDYHGYYDRMAGLLDLANAPFVSSLCIAAACRVAMQTKLLEQWIAIPCSDWAATAWAEADSPDARFAVVTSPRALSAAQDALRAAMPSASPGIQTLARSGISQEERLQAVMERSFAEQEALQALAFQAIAENCFPEVPNRPRWLGQRESAALAAQKAQAHAGPRLKISLQTSKNLEGDFDATFIETRREILVLSPSRFLAMLNEAGTPTEVQPDWFVLGGTGFSPHFQLVAIPYDKLPALYELRDPLSERAPKCAITVLRRFIDVPNLPVGGVVHMLELSSPNDLPLPEADAEPPGLFALICASAAMDEQWATSWLEPLRQRGAQMAVLIDVDPFDYVPFMARKTRFNMVRQLLEPGELGLPDNVTIVAFAVPDEPDFLMFAPCSESFSRSFALMVERGGYNIDLKGSLSDPQRKLLQMAVSHALKNEPQFGFCHWWRND